MNATEIKRLFKRVYGIPVRVRSGTGYVNVWIPSSGDNHTLQYDHEFPWELGKLCLQQVYPNNPNLHVGWCGNVSKHSIAMSRDHWSVVFDAIRGETSSGVM